MAQSLNLIVSNINSSQVVSQYDDNYCQRRPPPSIQFTLEDKTGESNSARWTTIKQPQPQQQQTTLHSNNKNVVGDDDDVDVEPTTLYRYRFDISEASISLANEQLLEAELHLYKLLPELTIIPPQRSKQKEDDLIYNHPLIHHHNPSSSSIAATTTSHDKNTTVQSSDNYHNHYHNRGQHTATRYQPKQCDLKTNLLEVSLYQIISQYDDNNSSQSTIGQQNEEKENLRLLDIRRIDLESVGWEVFYVKPAVTDWIVNGQLANIGLLLKAKSMLNERLQIGCLRFSALNNRKKLISNQDNHQVNHFQPILVIYSDDGIERSSISQPIKEALDNNIYGYRSTDPPEGPINNKLAWLANNNNDNKPIDDTDESPIPINKNRDNIVPVINNKMDGHLKTKATTSTITTENKCITRPLWLDFRYLMWSWIIMPSRIDLNQCIFKNGRQNIDDYHKHKQPVVDAGGANNNNSINSELVSDLLKLNSITNNLCRLSSKKNHDDDDHRHKLMSETENLCNLSPDVKIYTDEDDVSTKKMRLVHTLDDDTCDLKCNNNDTPYKLSAINILYYSLDHQVVLRQYNDVVSVGCRP